MSPLNMTKSKFYTILTQKKVDFFLRRGYIINIKLGSKKQKLDHREVRDMSNLNLMNLKNKINLIPGRLMKSVSAERTNLDTNFELRRKKEFVRNLLEQLQELDRGESLLHLEMVGKVSAFLSRKLKMKEEAVEEIELFAKLHDIGKIGIPGEVLNKPGRLTAEEFEIVKTHTEIGYQLLSHLNISRLGGDIIRYHHEKWNGQGYRGLSGEEIPVAARIVAVADVYDALRVKRAYKDAMTHEEAMEIILKDSGKHFDPAIVNIFLSSHQEIRNIYNTFLN